MAKFVGHSVIPVKKLTVAKNAVPTPSEMVTRTALRTPSMPPNQVYANRQAFAALSISTAIPVPFSKAPFISKSGHPKFGANRSR
jgi:hypothetical protein